MSKIAAFIYSFLIITQSFNFSFEEISKLQTLIEHAKYHHEHYGDSFFEFLSEHYGDETISHQDKHQEHKDLPFKDNQHVGVNLSFLNQTISFEIKHNEFTKIQLNFFYKDSFTNFEKRSVFQPPKLA